MNINFGNFGRYKFKISLTVLSRGGGPPIGNPGSMVIIGFFIEVFIFRLARSKWFVQCVLRFFFPLNDPITGSKNSFFSLLVFSQFCASLQTSHYSFGESWIIIDMLVVFVSWSFWFRITIFKNPFQLSETNFR